MLYDSECVWCLPCSAFAVDRELIRGSVEAEPWPLALDSGPVGLQSVSLEGWIPNTDKWGQSKKKNTMKQPQPERQAQTQPQNQPQPYPLPQTQPLPQH